ncbi:hypothetical protein C3Z06_30985 (plasmid) [Cupriavidus metallidurans]|jgi:hypothetical protein|nr:hypothetical protein C3Z06_30985 [Cupriavidus metallidurans]
MAMTQAEIREAIEWLVRDARYLARWARIHRKRGQLAGTWLADRTRANASYSFKLARQYKASLTAEPKPALLGGH